MLYALYVYYIYMYKYHVHWRLKTEKHILHLFQFCILYQHIVHCEPLLDPMASEIINE